MNDLFIGGGGFSGVLFVGALEYIHKNKLLDLKNFYGCSIGSLIGCLYIAGCMPKNMLTNILGMNLKEIVKYSFDNFLSDSYLLDDSLLETLIGFLWKYVNEEITIKEFSDKYNVNINIYTTNMTKNEYTNFNNIDYPDVKLKDILKATMSIPFIFKPVVINNDKYIDGCCKNLCGSPPSDVYICGYSIILSCPEKVNSYLKELQLIIMNRTKPRTAFLIECFLEHNPSTYLKLDTLDKKFIIDMYKKGIYFAKQNLKD
jgi:hypothetical protein